MKNFEKIKNDISNIKDPMELSGYLKEVYSNAIVWCKKRFPEDDVKDFKDIPIESLDIYLNSECYDLFDYGRRLKDALDKKIIKSAEKLKHTYYSQGQWYWNGYWQKAFKVLHKNFEEYNGHSRLSSVTILWEDGKRATHCTSLNKSRDFIIFPYNNEEVMLDKLKNI